MSTEIGTLVIVILKARNLPDKHSFSKQDPYAKVILNGVTQQTEIDKRGGQHPVWDAEFRFPIMENTSTKFRKLEVSCWAQEPRNDDLLGQGSVDITETLKTGEFDDWVKLETNKAYRGELYLEMTFFSSSSPPPGHTKPSSKPRSNSGLLDPRASNLTRRPSKLSPSDRLNRPTHAYAYPSGDPGSTHAPARISASKFKKVNNPLPSKLSETPPLLQPGRSGRDTLGPPSNSSSPPSSSRSSSASPSRRGAESPLPPLPEDLPAGLRPGGRIGGQGSIPVPATLRPGGNRPPALSESPPRSISNPLGLGQGTTLSDSGAVYQPVTGLQYSSQPASHLAANDSVPYQPVTGARTPPTTHATPAYTPVVTSERPPAAQLPAIYEPVTSTSGPERPPAYAAQPSFEQARGPGHSQAPSFPIPYESAAAPGPFGPPPVVNASPAPYEVAPANVGGVKPVSHGGQMTQGPLPHFTPTQYPPVPNVPYPPTSSTLYPSGTPQPWQPFQFPNARTPSPLPPAQVFSHQEDDLPDPYLKAKYSAPLPLPKTARESSPAREPSPAPEPWSRSPPRDHHRLPPSRENQQQSPPREHYRQSSAREEPSPPPSRQSPSVSPRPLPVPESGARKPSQSNPQDEQMMVAQRRAEEEFARRRAQEEEDMKFARRLLQEPKSPPSMPKNPELTDFQRKAAEELAKRRAQEEEDLELAKRLDFELNK